MRISGANIRIFILWRRNPSWWTFKNNQTLLITLFVLISSEIMFCFHFYPMFVYSIACCCKRYFTIKNVTIHCSHGLLLLLVLLLLLLFVRSCDEFSSCFDCVCVELSIVTTLVDIASLSWSCHVRYVRAPIHKVWGCVLDWPSPLSTPLLHASTNRHTHTYIHVMSRCPREFGAGHGYVHITLPYLRFTNLCLRFKFTCRLLI